MNFSVTQGSIMLTNVREKVARALCWKAGMDPDLTLGGDGVNFLWHEYEDAAEAAITTVLQSLIDMELPLSAIEAAETAQLNGLPTQERTFIPEVDSFRAILATLQQLTLP